MIGAGRKAVRLAWVGISRPRVQGIVADAIMRREDRFSLLDLADGSIPLPLVRARIDEPLGTRPGQGPGSAVQGYCCDFGGHSVAERNR